jgi:hypothetical protein
LLNQERSTLNPILSAWAIALAVARGPQTPETTIDPNPIVFVTRQCQITLVIQQKTQKQTCQAVLLTEGRYNANIHFNATDKSGLTFLTQQDFLISDQNFKPRRADTAVLGIVLRKPDQAPQVMSGRGWCSLTQTKIACQASTGEDFYLAEAEL